MYDMVHDCLRVTGLANHHDPLINTGDGVLALFRPVDEAPKTLLLSAFIPNLSTTLADHNAGFPDLKFRLRAVLHAGDVHFDPEGCFGEAVDVTFRLLCANAVKRCLVRARQPLVLVVSDHIYRTVVLQGYEGIDASTYTQVIRVRVGRGLHTGRIQVPELIDPADRGVDLAG